MTKFFYIFCLSLLISTVAFTSSAATLTVSGNLIVSEVDDEIVDHGFMGKNSTFTLNQGEHALIVRYKDVFEDLDFAEDRVVESQKFVVKFSIVQQKTLTLTTEKIKNLSQADHFAKAPELTLMDENNKSLVLELFQVSDYKLAKQVNLAVASFANTKSINNTVLPIKAKESTAQKSHVLTAKALTDDTLKQVNSLTMLKYWWQTASTTEKKQFKQWAFTKE
ncbi:MAG: DUF2057 domain-containing protein [Colwellia sp.]|nr:DUF2057 domain-containing protein [Colwellia sp.]